MSLSKQSSFQAPSVGSDVDAGKFKKLAQRVEETLSSKVIFKDPKQIPPPQVLVAPLNRDGAPPNVQHIHHGILKSFLTKGFDRTRPAIGICVEFKSEEGKKRLLEHNQRFTKSCKLLPQVDEKVALYGSLAASHLNVALRLIHSSGSSPIGDLAALTADDESLKDVVQNGHRWWVLPEDTPPDRQVDISLWRNQDQNENQGTHEIEILQTIMSTAHEMSETTKKVQLGDLIARAQRRNPAKISSTTLAVLCKLYVGFLADGQQDLVQELVDFHAEKVNPRELVISTSFFQLLVNEEVLVKFPHFKMYLILTQYTNEKVRQQASGPSQAGFIEPNSIVQLVKKPDQLKALEDKVRSLRTDLLPLLEAELGPRQAKLELSVYIDLIMRCLLGKPWPPLDIKLTAPLGKFSSEKVLQLGKHWAKLLDLKFPHVNFGSLSGLRAADEKDEGLEVEVDLDNVRSLKKAPSDPLPDLVPKFVRGDAVVVIRRMSWVIPQSHKEDYRRDLHEGTEGIVEGWADHENRQVLLKVLMDLPDGKQHIVHQAYPRNLMKTEEYKLMKAGRAPQEPQEEQAQPASGSSKRNAPPEWLLQGSEPSSVKVQPKWTSLLSDEDKLNKIFWLKSKIGVVLESLQETLPQYTEKDLMVCDRQNDKGAWRTELWTLKPFPAHELIFAPLGNQLKDTHLMVNANAVVTLPKHGRGAHPEHGNLAIDGRGHTVLAETGVLDDTQHRGNLFWLVQRTSDMKHANMVLETVAWEHKVTLTLQPLKKKKHTVGWGSSELPGVPVLLNKKPLKAHTRLAVFVPEPRKPEPKKGEAKK